MSNFTPTPMLGGGQAADWVFMFKFNASSFPHGDRPASKTGLFGGTFQDYKGEWSQQYVYASNHQPTLQKGSGALGTSLDDPLGATFAQIYQNDCNYVVWNDQFYKHPMPSKNKPWGHSKGAIAWNDDGEGMVLQVSTPSWPGSGSERFPRKGDGNTLGTVHDDDIEVSQHFFALKLTKADVLTVLTALSNASVATRTSIPALCQNGGPADIQAAVKRLGKLNHTKKCTTATLSSGVKLISKPSLLPVPPWQLVSAKLDSLPLRVASWWAHPEIPSTSTSSTIHCWAAGLGEPGPVDIATTGVWDGVEIGLAGGTGTTHNHAKIGVSQDPTQPLSIFGDMNQQGALAPAAIYPNQRCTSSQNGRGGTFYVLENKAFWESLSAMLKGESAAVGD